MNVDAGEHYVLVTAGELPPSTAVSIRKLVSGASSHRENYTEDDDTVAAKDHPGRRSYHVGAVSGERGLFTIDPPHSNSAVGSSSADNSYSGRGDNEFGSSSGDVGLLAEEHGSAFASKAVAGAIRFIGSNSGSSLLPSVNAEDLGAAGSMLSSRSPLEC